MLIDYIKQAKTNYFEPGSSSSFCGTTVVNGQKTIGNISIKIDYCPCDKFQEFITNHKVTNALDDIEFSKSRLLYDIRISNDIEICVRDIESSRFKEEYNDYFPCNCILFYFYDLLDYCRMGMEITNRHHTTINTWEQSDNRALIFDCRVSIQKATDLLRNMVNRKTRNIDGIINAEKVVLMEGELSIHEQIGKMQEGIAFGIGEMLENEMALCYILNIL